MEDAVTLPQALPMSILPPTPAGLETLYSLCRKIYPDQVNPLQVTALLKYWLGGPDPLDYISMYANPGIPHENIPPHWHYISFGLSDLHGDGRVHGISGPNDISGFGFELTFRLKREPGETAPPTWPATLMQSLAKYVFQSGNNLCSGDHVSWHCALDNSESRIQHMLMTSDVQLATVHTPFGTVEFVQIIGVCADELRAAQKWNGSGVLNMLTQLPNCGLHWHITDMRRGETIFDIDVSAHDELERGFEAEGSNLSGVSARCSWTEQTECTTADVHSNSMSLVKRNSLSEMSQSHHRDGRTSEQQQLYESIRDGRKSDLLHPNCESRLDGRISEREQEEIKSVLQKGLTRGGVTGGGGGGGEYGKDGQLLEEADVMTSVRRLEGVHLVFNLEAGSLLPLAIRGRVKHGRHFTFKSMLGETAITLVADTVTGTLVDGQQPYAVAPGNWLQVLVPDDLAAEMGAAFQPLAAPDHLLQLPKTWAWPHRNLAITIVADKLS